MRLRLLIAGVLLGACTKSSTPDAVVIDTSATGTIRVRNTRLPDSASSNGWRLVEERTIDPADGTPGEMTQVSAVLADASGRIYVGMSGPRAIKVYAPDGEFLRTIGREGGGPGEFRYPSLGIDGDTLLVHDPILGRLTRFTPTGEVLRSHPSECCLMSPRLDVDRDGRAFPMRVRPLSDGTSGIDYVVYDRGGQIVDTVAAPEAPADRTWRTTARERPGGPMISMSATVPFTPTLERGLRSDGTLVWGTTDRLRLTISRTGRDTIRTVHAELPVVSLRAGQIDTAIANAVGGALAWKEPLTRVARRADVPTTRPAWSAFIVDAQDRIWVVLPDSDRRFANLLVLDPDGRAAAQLPLPSREFLRGFWSRDRVYYPAQDAMGRPVIKVSRLVTTAGN